MKKKKYIFNENGWKLKRVDIIQYRPWESSAMTIDVRKLMEMTDEELLRYKAVGPVSLKKINEARKVLKELLFETTG